jgi:hypothetical protein
MALYGRKCHTPLN